MRLVTALCNQPEPEAFTSHLGDDQSGYLVTTVYTGTVCCWLNSIAVTHSLTRQHTAQLVVYWLTSTHCTAVWHSQTFSLEMSTVGNSSQSLITIVIGYQSWIPQQNWDICLIKFQVIGWLAGWWGDNTVLHQIAQKLQSALSWNLGMQVQFSCPCSFFIKKATVKTEGVILKLSFNSWLFSTSLSCTSAVQMTSQQHCSSSDCMQ